MKECLAIEVDVSARVTHRQCAGAVGENRGLPQSAAADNGPKFVRKAPDEGPYCNSRTRIHELGKSQQNAYIESFNEKLQNEYRDEHWFLSMLHARQIIAAWRQEQ